MENFTHAPDEAYREQVLPASCRARVAVEAADPVRAGQVDRARGRVPGDGDISARQDRRRMSTGHFGITAQRIVELGRAVMGR